jgi:hypothetical protein
LTSPPAGDLMPTIKQWLEEGYKNTKSAATPAEFYTWTEHYDNWICVIRPLARLLSQFDRSNSLVLFRFIEVNKTLLWLYICILFGAYHPAIRELRYMLESMVQAYYVDTEHSDSDMKCKLEIIKEIDRERFAALMDRTSIPEKQEIRVLYSELSKYVHSTFEELISGTDDGIPFLVDRAALGFELETFKKSVEMTNRTLDAVYCIALARFPEVIEKIESRKLFLESLKEHHCNMTLRLVRRE